MGKTEVENLDLKSKLNIVSGIIANAKKDLESLKIEINDPAMSKKNLNSLNNEFIEHLKESLKVNDNLIKIDDDIFLTKSEYHVNIKNWCHVVENHTLINITNCIKLKSMHREYVDSLRKIKNDFYSTKKDCDSIRIDLKKLKGEYINNFNKRAKVHQLQLSK